MGSTAASTASSRSALSEIGVPSASQVRYTDVAFELVAVDTHDDRCLDPCRWRVTIQPVDGEGDQGIGPDLRCRAVVAVLVASRLEGCFDLGIEESAQDRTANRIKLSADVGHTVGVFGEIKGPCLKLPALPAFKLHGIEPCCLGAACHFEPSVVERTRHAHQPGLKLTGVTVQWFERLRDQVRFAYRQRSVTQAVAHGPVFTKRHAGIDEFCPLGEAAAHHACDELLRRRETPAAAQAHRRRPQRGSVGQLHRQRRRAQRPTHPERRPRPAATQRDPRAANDAKSAPSKPRTSAVLESTSASEKVMTPVNSGGLT